MTYKIQIDDLVRDATAEEAAAIEAREAEVAAREADIEAKADAKAALLEKLGITEEEAVLLLS
jgi:non-ribosomal peptide synthetase component E (peptide arylation enzyme)